MDFDLLNFVSRPLQDPASTCVTLQIPMEIGDVAKQKRKVGSSTKKILSPKSHILDSNGLWYSSFWSVVPKNHQNLKILVSKFVPRGFEARRTWGFEAQRHGVSRGGAGVSRGSAKGFRGAAPLIKDFSDLSFRAVPRGPI